MGVNKYGAKPCEVDGIRFASRAEARHYGQLKILERAGHITDLQLQVRYPLVVNGVKIGTYIADFLYKKNGMYCCVDVKGVRTPVYKLKRNLMKACHNLDITEIG